jgi:hypothetical protein
MRYNLRFVVIIAMMVLFLGRQSAYSQSTEKFELGGQFSSQQISIPSSVATTISQTCTALPCPPIIIVSSQERQSGFGGRISYNVTNNIAAEAELNFFPNANFGNEVFSGHYIQGLFGAKIGKHFEKVGIFAKWRPGFLRVSKGDLQQPPGCGLAAVYPFYAGCFEIVSRTHFAFDIGGVFEIYPGKKSVIRFDLGDTIIRTGVRKIPLVVTSTNKYFAVVFAEPDSTNNFQTNISVAFRF